MISRRRQHAFTFAEILAALVFLALLVPAIMEGITLCSRASLMAERGAFAVSLAQNKLDELALNDAWSREDLSGDFGEDFPNFRWEAEHAPWEETGNMEELTVRAFFNVQGREESVTLTTLVSGSTANR